MAASKAGTGKMQEQSGTLYARKQGIIQRAMGTCYKDTEASVNGFLLTPSGTV